MTGFRPFTSQAPQRSLAQLAEAAMGASQEQFPAYFAPEQENFAFIPTNFETDVIYDSSLPITASNNRAPVIYDSLLPINNYGSSQLQSARVVEAKEPTVMESIRARLQSIIKEKPSEIKPLLIKKFGEAHKEDIDPRMVRVKYNATNGNYYLERTSTIMGRKIKRILTSEDVDAFHNVASPYFSSAYQQQIAGLGAEPVQSRSARASANQNANPEQRQPTQAAKVTYAAPRLPQSPHQQWDPAHLSRAPAVGFHPASPASHTSSEPKKPTRPVPIPTGPGAPLPAALKLTAEQLASKPNDPATLPPPITPRKR